MKDLLVGSTGFVGGNLIKSHKFDMTCHSTDITLHYSSNPEVCIYAGIPSAMFLANSNPNADLNFMKIARENIRKINPHKLVLISTIAVYSHPKHVDENSETKPDKLSAYGRNRLQLEEWIREDWDNALIIRLPALYGTGLRKNFLFDLHFIIPIMLKKEKYKELYEKSKLIELGYKLADNGYYKLNYDSNIADLKKFFEHNDFNALSFTDSRSCYQFYNLNRLWNDISVALKYGISTLNISTPPVTAKEVYEYVTEMYDWKNELKDNPYDYDIRSIHAGELGGSDGYLITKEQELEDINQFMKEWK